MIPIWNYSKLINKNSEGYWEFQFADKNISYTEDGHKISAAREKNSFWYNHRNLVIKYHLGLSSPEWLLDLGGGTGYVSKYLQARGLKTVLVEPVPEGAKIAKDRGVRPIINGTLPQIQFEDQSIPAIGLFDVLEHIENEAEILKECHRILKPGGIMLITVPALSILWSSFDKHVGHFRRYNKRQIKQLLKKHGFTIVHCEYFYFILTIPIFFLRKVLPRFKHHTDSNHTLQFKFVHSLIQKLLKLELHLSKKLNLPFGSSLIVTIKKD